MPDGGEDRGPGVRVPPPVLVAALLAAAWALNRLAPVALGPPLPTLGLPVMFAAVGWMGWALLALVRAGNDPRPDRPDAALVASGPFALGRNPIYLGFLGLCAGMALNWGTLWGWLALGTAFLLLHFAVVRKEEAYLRARFGAPYEDYARRVRRWI
jgi:protein-S-isoprenylcysteine O-methyltransferase Ste14